MKIGTLANGVLREMEARGYSETTLQQRNKIFKTIERWFDNWNGGELTRSTAENYLVEISDRLQSGKIEKYYFNQLKCAVLQLCKYAETGTLQFTCASGKRIFQPSAESISVIEHALSATNLKPNFQYKLHSILRQFFCFVEGQGLHEQDVTREVMISFIHHCCDRSQAYVAYIVRSLEVLSEYLMSIGVMSNKPNFKFVVPKRNPRKMISPFSEREVAAILSCIDRVSPTGKRDYAVILLAISTGLRAGDLANLKLTDIDWKSQTISITQGKTKKSLKIAVTGQVCNAVSDYILNSRPSIRSNNIFLRERAPFTAFSCGASLGKIFVRACVKANIEQKPGRGFHSLRRTFGTWLAAEEVPITTIAQMLGHSEMNSSKPYLSFNDKQMHSCAMGFEEIPLKGGVYYGLH